MNLSESFVLRRIQDGDINVPAYDRVSVLPFPRVQQDYCQPALVSKEGYFAHPITVFSDVRYDPEAEYDYAAVSYCSHDGTFLFTMELVAKILDRLRRADTYNTDAGMFHVSDGQDVTIHYTVGDFVILDGFGESPDSSRPFLRQHTSVCLPIGYKVTYEDQNTKKKG